MIEQQSKDLERLTKLLPSVVGIAALLLVVAYVWVFKQLPARESLPAWGVFGNYVGGLLNPLVSTFTLIVAVKVWQQQKIELQESKEALEGQAETAVQQRQEQRFFDLLRVLQRVEDSSTHTYVTPGGGDRWMFHGKEAIREWTARFDRTFEMTRRYGLGQIIHNGKATLDKPHLQQQWAAVFPQTPFASHLRTIYRILKDADHLLGDQRYRYVKLLRSQLSAGMRRSGSERKVSPC